MTALWLTPDALVADINNPIAWNPYAFNYHDPVNYVDPSGHFPIWDLLDVGSFFLSARDFFRAPSWANLGWWALDAVGLLPIFTAAWVRHADDLARVLVVGENSFEYSQALRRTLGAEYDIVATSLESADELMQLGFKVPQDAPGLKILHKVDARDLARHFPGEKFDAIIFNTLMPKVRQQP